MEDLKEKIKGIKHQFMIFRNGIVADTLRNAGYPYSIIFGLQLPQLSGIAGGLTPDIVLADTLWDDKNVRESRLLACYLYSPQEITIDKAIELAQDVATKEEADILTFRLLRHLPFRKELKESLMEREPDAYIIRTLERFED